MSKQLKENPALAALKRTPLSEPREPLTPPSRPEGQEMFYKLPVEKATKVSLSLYPSDLRRLDEIRQLMQRYGIRKLTDSEALRLACRAVAVDASLLLETYRNMQKEDLRKKQRVIVG